MLKGIRSFFRKRERADINRQLDHVYAQMREATEQANALKALAEKQEAGTLQDLRIQEQALITKAQRMDTEDMHLSLPQRAARAW